MPVTCGLESTNDRPTGGDRVRECRSPSFSRMLELLKKGTLQETERNVR
jgi:hypothetical protein